MNKKIIIAAVVLALLLVVAPWGVGILAEKRVDRGLEEVVKAAPYLTIVDRKFTRGWFTSEQQVTFEMFGPWVRALNGQAETQPASEMASDVESDDPATAAAPSDAQTSEGEEVPPPPPPAPIAPIKVTVRNHIVHGPVLWFSALGIARVDSTVDIPEEIRAKLIEVFGKEPVMEVSTRVRFFGGGTTTISGDGRDFSIDGKDQKLSYDAFWFKVGYSSHLDRVDVVGEWPRFEVTGPAAGANAGAANFKFEGLTVDGSSKRVRGDLYDGDFKLSIKNTDFGGSGQPFTRVAGLHYIVDSTIDDDFMDIALKFGSGEAKSKMLDELDLAISGVHYDFTIRRLHLDTLEKLVKEIKASYSRPVETVADLDAAISEPLKEYGVQLLKHDPELVIDRIGISTADGDLYLKGVIKLKGVTEQDMAAGALGLIGKIEADIGFEMAQKLGSKLPNGASAVATALDQGYARLEGKNVVSRVEFRQGVLKINGKVQGIPPLGGAPQPPPPQE